jgi:iron(III) transport system permease protein
MVVLSLLSLWAATAHLKRSEYASGRMGTAGANKDRRLTGWKRAGVVGFCTLVLTLSLAPHIGILILSFARVWSFSLLPSHYTLANYGEIFLQTPHFVKNTLLYCGLAAVIDVVLGTLIAFLLVRGRVAGKGLLDGLATLPLAIPGVVLAIGYLRVFHNTEVPFLGGPLTASWFILVIAYAARRLPYTLRSCYAAMQQIHPSTEEAALNLGANRRRAFLKITFPLMLGGVVAGGILSFITSAVELSSTMLLVPRNEDGPLSFGIYIYMQSAVGRGPGAGLGVVAILLVFAGIYTANRLFRGGSGTAFKM